MPVIAIANPKGGAGKSTLALILGTTCAAKGVKTTILDCDPNQPIALWAKGDSRNDVEIVANVTDENLIDLVEAKRAERQLVIVDLEGTASTIVAYAIAMADLVLIPMQASAIDAHQAGRTVRLVQKQQRLTPDRDIALRAVLTRTNPQIPTKNQKIVVADLKEHDVPMLATHLHQRTAYQSVFTYRLAVDELDPSDVSGLDAARQNANALADEVVGLLLDIQRKGRSAGAGHQATIAATA